MGGQELGRMALHRPRQADAERVIESFNGSLRDELLNEELFLSMDHARVQIAAWVEDYNQEGPHSALGYQTPAAFADEVHKQWPALMRNKTARL